MKKSGLGAHVQIIIIVVILALCAVGAYILYRPRESAQTVAVISVDGNELRRIYLDSAENETFSIEGQTGKHVSFEVLDGAIRFVDVRCPDGICEKAGWCDAPGERAVCLPNRTALVCYDAAEVA